MEATNDIEVKVFLSGWLASYFDQNTMIVTTKSRLSEAVPDMVKQVTEMAHSSLPNGGMHVLVNGVQARTLIAEDYALQPGDEVTFVPVVAGGDAHVYFE